MPYTDPETRRAAGREAQRRYRVRHPESEAAYRQKESYRESQRRYARSERGREKSRRNTARWRERQKIPAGAATALMSLERSLRAATEQALVKKLRGAITNLRRLYGLPEAPFQETGDMRRRKVNGHGL